MRPTRADPRRAADGGRDASIASDPRARAGAICPVPSSRRSCAELADRPELWIDLVQHDSTQRLYEELLSDDHLTAWLICWMDDHDTGFHDHDVSAGAVAVVGGAVREERLAIDGPPRDRDASAPATASTSRPPTSTACATPASTPRSRCTSTRRRCCAWAPTSIGDDGVLARHPVSSGEELRPAERVG